MAETKAAVVRFDPEVLARVDAAAKARRWSRNTFLVWAAQRALEDVGGGVPDLPPNVPAGNSARAVTPRSSPRAPVVKRQVFNRGPREPRPPAPEIEGVRRGVDSAEVPELPKIAARRVR